MAMHFVFRLMPRILHSVDLFKHQLPPKERTPVREEGLNNIRSGFVETLCGALITIAQIKTPTNTRLITSAVGDGRDIWAAGRLLAHRYRSGMSAPRRLRGSEWTHFAQSEPSRFWPRTGQGFDCRPAVSPRLASDLMARRRSSGTSQKARIASVWAMPVNPRSLSVWSSMASRTRRSWRTWRVSSSVHRRSRARTADRENSCCLTFCQVAS